MKSIVRVFLIFSVLGTRIVLTSENGACLSSSKHGMDFTAMCSLLPALPLKRVKFEGMVHNALLTTKNGV